MSHTSRIKASARKSSSSARESQRRQRLRRRAILADPERLEERLAPAVSSSISSGILTVASDGSDSIAITTAAGNVKVNGADPGASAAASSSITKIVVTGGPGNNVIDLSGVHTADFTTLASVSIDGGAGNDSITGSDFADTLTGGAGDDTYVFGNNWGADTVVENSNGGTDTLDFSSVTTTLTVSGDKKSITSGTSSVTQTVTAAEQVDVNLASGFTTPLKNAFSDLDAFVGRIQDKVNGLQQLVHQLPLLDQAAGGSLAELLNLTDSFHQLSTQAATKLNAITSNAKLSSVIGQLNAFASSLPSPLNNIKFSADYRGTGTADTPTATSSGQLEALIDVHVPSTSVLSQQFKIDLGADAASAGLTLNGMIDVNASLAGDLAIGVTTGASPTAFLVPGGGLDLSASATASALNAAIHLGFLGASVSNGSISLGGSVHVGLVDPATDAGEGPGTTDGRISLSELTSAPVSSLATSSVSNPTFDANLPVSVDAGVQIAGADILSATLTLTLPSGADVFSGFAPKFSLLTAGGVDLLDFSNITPIEVMGMLEQVFQTFVSLAGSNALSTPIPFTGKTLGDVLDYATTFKTQVLDPLFVSGNALRPDDNGDNTPDFTFSNIQELVDDLTTSLGLSTPLKAAYDSATKELSFTISFDRALGFGEAKVAEAQRGDASHNEKQSVTVNATASGGTLADTFKLAFPDPTKNGILQFTDAIAYDATAATVQTKLAALAGIGSGNVMVTGSPGAYTIEFQGALAGTALPLLVSDASQLAGTFPVNFGASLGDFAGVSTTGDFSMAASLNAGLTFGVDLNPSQTLEITPPVASPSAGVTVSLPTGAASFKTQILTVHAANGGTYTLSLSVGGTTKTTAAIDRQASETTIQTALTSAGITGATVSPPTVSGVDRVYNITFNSTSVPTSLLAPDSTLITGAADNGQLTAAAHFSVQLFNQAIIVSDGTNPAQTIPQTLLGPINNVTVSPNSGNDSLADLADQVQTAINTALANGGLTLGFLSGGQLATGALTTGGSVTATGNPLTKLGNDIGFTLTLTGSHAQVLTGFLRAVDVLDPNATAADRTLFNADGTLDTSKLNATVSASTLASRLQDAINGALHSAGVSGFTVSVGTSGGKLTFGVSAVPSSGDTIALSFTSPIEVDAGGGRIALSTPPVQFSPLALAAAVNVDRLDQVTADYGDTAFQELGLVSAPTHFDGKTADAIDFTLVVNGANVHVTLPAQSTTTSLAQLVTELQSAIDAQLTATANPDASPAANFAAGDVEVFLVDPAGNRIGFRGKDGVVHTIALNVPDTANNGAVTALGFAPGNGPTQRSKATEFFIQDVHLGGSLALIANDVSATATLGFLAVTASGHGTVGAAGSNKFIDANADFSLKNPLDGSTRLTPDVIIGAFKHSQFLFDAAHEGGTADNPSTGIVDGSISGGLGFTLDIAPDGALAGLSSTLNAHADLSITSPNWLIAPPSLSDPLGFGTDAQTLGTTAVILGQAVPASGRLAQNVSFILSDGTHSAVGVLHASDTATFSSATQLLTALQGAINDAVARLEAAGGPSGVTISATLSPDNKVQLTTSSSGLTIQGNVIKLDFAGPDFDSILNNLRHLSFSDVIGALRQLVGFLRSLDGSGGAGSAIAGALTYKLPLINRSVSDLVDIAGALSDKLDEIEANPAASLQELQDLLNNELGIPITLQLATPTIGTDTHYVINIGFNYGTGVELARPFDLDLADAGLPSFLTDLVGVSASGNLDVSANASFDLKLGLDLTDKELFIQTGDDGTKLEASASASGNGLNFDAKLGPFGLFVIDGHAGLNGDITVTLKDPNDNGRLVLAGWDGNSVTSDLSHLGDFIDTSSIAVTGTASASLPLFVGTKDHPIPLDFAGSHPGENNALGVGIDVVKLIMGGADPITFTLPDFNFSNFKVPGVFALLSDPATVIDGMDHLLQTLQDGLNGQVLGNKLPFIGDLLAHNPAADFLGEVRTDLLEPLANVLRENNVNLQGLVDLFKQTLVDVLGPGGPFDSLVQHETVNGADVAIHGLLQDDNHDGQITTDDITESGVDPSNPFDPSSFIQFDFDLGKSFTFTAPATAFDLGIPALGISANFQPSVTLAFNLHIGFGVDTKKGFYFVTNYADPGTHAPTPELTVSADATLGDGASATGNLLFLALRLNDGVSGFGTSTLHFGASVDLVDPGTGANNDGRLTFSELTTSPLSSIFKPQIEGSADFRATATVDFSTLGAGFGNVLPSISADLLAHFGFSATPATGFHVDAPSVALANINLDLGSFISDFAAPILGKIKDVLSPLAWLIGPDGFLNKRIPLLSDLAGKTITGKDLILLFDPDDGPAVVKFLDFAQQLYFLANLADQAAQDGDVELPFGDLVLSGKDYFTSHYASLFTDSGSIFDLQIPNLNSLKNLNTSGLSDKIHNLASSLNVPAVPPGTASTTKTFTSGVSKPGSIDFALLHPETIFKLLMGQPDVTLVTVTLPEFSFNFFYRQQFPIIGPLVGTFGGGVGGTLHLAFGYDTHGLQQFESDHNPADLLSGFFIVGRDPVTGADVPEATLNAQIAVGAALSLGFASVGVEGGITATIDFNLDDLNNDGKIRFDEMAANLLANSFDPLAIFDIGGELDFFLRAYFEINLGFFKIHKDFEFAHLTLLQFDIPFDRPAILGSVSNGVLTLNVGPNASNRLHGDTSDDNETIHAESDGAGNVVVWSTQFDVDHDTGVVLAFHGVHQIVADGGAGNDTIDLSGLQSDVSAVVHGGDGNDTIIGGAGDDTLDGDAGNDVIVGDGGKDTLDGGDGNDELFGDGLPASLPAGVLAAGFALPSLPGFALGGTEDQDAIEGGSGGDLIYGGGGADTLMGGPDDDWFLRSAGGDTYALADLGSVDHITGTGINNDTLDFSGKSQNLTFLLNTGSIDVGFNQKPNTAGTSIDDFNNQLIVDDPNDITTIIGGDEADTFHVYGTAAAGVTLDGGKGSDTYIFHLPASGDPVIKATVDDNGNPWDSNDLIRVLGTDGADTIGVTSGTITLDAAQAAPKEVVTYVAPDAGKNVLQIHVEANGGDDRVNVASTALTVPVRVDTGDGNDVVTVGNGTLGGIVGLARPGLNAPIGVGPLALVGGAGHDAVVFDDSTDPTGRTGNLTAFQETREGFASPVEVGVLSGLGMSLTSNDVAGAGRVEFEGFEADDVRLGTGGNTFTVGGTAIFSSLPQNRQPNVVGALTPDGDGLTLSATQGANVTATAASATFDVNNDVGRQIFTAGGGRALITAVASATQATVTVLDVFSSTTVAAGAWSVGNGPGDTIAGMTVVTGGPGGDTVNLLDTQPLDRGTLNGSLGLLGASTTTAGDDTHNAVQQVTTALAAHDVGDFTLGYRYEQTKPIPFGATEQQVHDALVGMYLIGFGANEDNVDVQRTTAGGNYVYTITFKNELADQPVASLVPLVAPLVVKGGAGVDHLNVQSVREETFYLGGAGDDTVRLNVDAGTLAPRTSNGINAAITVDGEGGSDTYDVHTIGGATSSLINVFDTGAAADGSDALNVYGTANPDLFLLRAGAGQGALAFIALLNTDPSKTDAQQPVERVNYDVNLENIVLNTVDNADGSGDQAYVDDTRAPVTINGGSGADFFQVGQLYQTPRTSDPSDNPTTNIADGDAFATIETTKGWLSNGVSYQMTINGGDGNDNFIVFHNLAVVNLNGENGNDTFVVQAFALVGSQDDQRAITDISGGIGADNVQYAVDAPVNIDGGDGVDTVIIIGTEFGDDFVITDTGVFGAGLDVNYVNIEHLTIDGAEGDDRFFILGTAPGVVTEVDGGLGSDLFSVDGPTPRNGVTSKNLHGHSGVVSHDVVSSDPNSAYNGIDVQGISANVADNDEPAVVITQSDGGSSVVQGGAPDSITVALSRPPISTGPSDTNPSVTISVVPPKGLVFLDAFNQEIRKADGTANGIALTFNTGNWNVAQIVRFTVDTHVTGIPNFGDIALSVAPDGFKGTLGFASNPGDGTATLTMIAASPLAFPLPGAQGLPQGLRGQLVTITDAPSNPAAVGQTRLIISNTANTLTLDKPWSIVPPANAKYQVLLFSGLALPNVHVRMYSAQKAELVVNQSQGNTSVAQDPNGTVADRVARGADDTLSLRLSQAPQAGETVTIALDGSGQLQFFDSTYQPITSITFDASHPWNVPQTVYVEAIDGSVVRGFRQVDLNLTMTSSLGGSSEYDGQSQTLTVDVADDNAPGVRVLESNGTTDVVEGGATDSYQIVLTKPPASGETVTVNAVAEPTRTDRGGGANGLRSFDKKVQLSLDGVHFYDTLPVIFDASHPWNVPQTVYVKAVDNGIVDGTDTTVFPPLLSEANNVRGPLILKGGPGDDRTGLTERPAVLLPYELDVKPHIGAVVSAAEATQLTPATVTVHAADITTSVLDGLGIDTSHITGPVKASDLIHLTIQITDGPAKNKARIITDAQDNGDGTWTLTLNHSWFSPFTQDSSVPDASSHYTLQATNPNLLVDERDQTDLLQVYDTDNVSSYNDLNLNPNPQAVGRLFFDNTFPTGTGPNGPTFLDMYRITGLGMGGDRVIGGENAPGGVTFDSMEDVDVNLGPGNNHFTIDNTPAGAITRLNAGAGDDLVDVRSVSGHTFVNLGAGADTVNVHNTSDQIKDLLGLLTVSGDVPQATVTRLVNGAVAQAPLGAVDDIQQVAIDATGGTFTLSLGGSTTGPLAYNISAADLQTALASLTSIGSGNVAVTKAGNIYRIEFVNGMGGKPVGLLAADDLKLTNGASVRDTLNVIDAGTTADTTGLLTSSSLTGLSTQQVNEIQDIFVDADQGTFTLSFNGAITGPLPYNASAADIQAALQGLAGIQPGDVAVTRNDRDIVVRFQGNLANKNVPQLVADGTGLLRSIEPIGGGTVNGTTLQPSLQPGLIQVFTRVEGSDTTQLNDLQVLTVNATGGAYTLSLLGGTVTTAPIPFDASAAALQDALQAAFAAKDPAETFKIDVTVNKYGNVYLVAFQGKLRRVDGGLGVDLLAANTASLTGTVGVTTRMDGLNYYGIEHLNVAFGSGRDVLNVQGTSPGSNGFAAQAGNVAVTDISLGDGPQNSAGQIFVSSNADLDLATATADLDANGTPDFDFLTGNLDDVRGALNIDAGSGRHRLMVSDEAATVGDSNVLITGQSTHLPGTPASLGLAASADVWVTGLAPAGISYKANPDGTNAGNFFDGVSYWTGKGNDTVHIDGIQKRTGGRTMTLLNTGLGNDNVTVSLADDARSFFALNTMGGAESADPSFRASSVPAGATDNDTVDASQSTLPLVIFGGLGQDNIQAGQNKDVVFGDFGRVQFLDPMTGALIASLGFGGRGDFTTSQALDPAWIFSRNLTFGATDTIQGMQDDDILVGGAAGDLIDGNAGNDLVFGDAVQLENRFTVTTNPRFQALTGTRIYSDSNPDDTQSGLVQVSGQAQSFVNQDGTPEPLATWKVDTLYHSSAIQTANDNSFGDDYIAGGAGNDVIFGQLGNDTIQGDGSIATAIAAQGPQRVGASRDASGVLNVTPSFEAATDGDDYIEGGGGNDVIFGGLGQDDIVGGSSSLFSLNTPDLRPDGNDTIFGGSGQRIGRNDQVPAVDTIFNDQHARDADAIAGDNANIYRLVGVNGAPGGAAGVATYKGFLAFNYDTYSTTSRIIPRAVQLLDYTPGTGSPSDIGGPDEIHGESGDDVIYGMTGNFTTKLGNVIFGDANDDDIVGGWGNDWISGGTGDDGILGDDGRISSSRNGTAEPLYGVVATTQQDISTPGNLQTATINVTGQLKKAVDLIPEGFGGNDIVYGGLGNDFLHGGAGDDAMSGAEAPATGFISNAVGVQGIESDFVHPVNPGNSLGYDPVTRKLAAYDAYNPLTKIQGFFLNFDAYGDPNNQANTKVNDGNDVLFGDTGNDWLVGGTNNDNLYGGAGDDLLNLDDNLDTASGLNNQPDAAPFNDSDRAYGGSGLDVLIANTGGDRMIDWVGEFNSYLVPFSPFGARTISRALQPQLPEFLYALSQSDGADATRVAPTYGAGGEATSGVTYDGVGYGDASRFGEPYGELGLVLQKDPAWQDQTGAPRDPQPGNVPGTQRDTIFDTNFNSNGTAELAPDSGSWGLVGGGYQPTAAAGDSTSLMYFDQWMPPFVEIATNVSLLKGGTKQNGFLLFGYVSQGNFLYAGVDAQTGQLRIGRRGPSGWVDAVTLSAPITANAKIPLDLTLNGSTATLVATIRGRQYTLQYAFPTAFGVSMLGVGTDSAISSYNDITMTKLPIAFTYATQQTFADGVAHNFTPQTGTWAVANSLYTGAPDASGTAITTRPLAVNPSSYLEFSATVNTRSTAGLVFDYYSPANFKYAMVVAGSNQVILGHRTAAGWVTDGVASATINAGTAYTLKVALSGRTVGVGLNGTSVLNFTYNELLNDGGLGFLTRGGAGSFGNMLIQGDDPAYRNGGFNELAAPAPAQGPATGTAADVAALTPDQLKPIVTAAILRWLASNAIGARDAARLADIQFQITPLPGPALGQEVAGTTVEISPTAAGYGWFIDSTPLNDAEFARQAGANTWTAQGASPAAGRMDLLTVVMHELGHALGLGDLDAADDPGDLMDETLAPGVRRLPGVTDLLAGEVARSGSLPVVAPTLASAGSVTPSATSLTSSNGEWAGFSAPPVTLPPKDTARPSSLKAAVSRPGLSRLRVAAPAPRSLGGTGNLDTRDES